jgi:cold shock CspA family protein
MDGIVRSYDYRKGFGFITPLVGQPGTVADVFFHISTVKDGLALPAGARVSFLVVRGLKGAQACDVRVKQERLPEQRSGARETCEEMKA